MQKNLSLYYVETLHPFVVPIYIETNITICMLVNWSPGPASSGPYTILARFWGKDLPDTVLDLLVFFNKTGQAVFLLRHTKWVPNYQHGSSRIPYK